MLSSIEQIDLLRKRANINYEEAKKILENCNGDIVEALIYLEKNKKVKKKNNSECTDKFYSTVKRLLQKGNETKIVARKKGNTVLTVPVNIGILFSIFAFPVVIGSLILALVTKHSIRIKKDSGDDIKVTKVLGKMTNKVTSVVNDISKKEDYKK